MRRRVMAIVVCALSLNAAITAQKPPPITAATARAIESWVKSVKEHVPGEPDDAVVTTAALSYDDRVELNAGMGLFLIALTTGKYATKGNAAAKEIAEAARGAGRPDALGFLKRAAILHADAAVYGDRNSSRMEAPPPGSPRTEEIRIGRGSTRLEPNPNVPPLLVESRIFLHRDGEVVGGSVTTWNWPFARSLLDLLLNTGARPKPPPDPFVVQWYHATSAYMFASGTYGDLTSHLNHAGNVLPNAALVLFDRGCYAELLGLPLLQALVPERDAANQKLNSVSGGSGWTPPNSLSLGIRPAEQTNADAERLYRRAIEIDPASSEARVRLARLLELRRRYEDSAAQLSQVTANAPDDALGFYAHLFAGRTAQALGRMDEASRHYEEATARFPNAQSALLASSLLAVLRSDRAAARVPIERLGLGTSDSAADPWWAYYLCAGRDSEELLNALWAAVPR